MISLSYLKREQQRVVRIGRLTKAAQRRFKTSETSCVDAGLFAVDLAYQIDPQGITSVSLT
jgi:hypothetical protein